MNALLAQYPHAPILLACWLGFGALLGALFGWWRNRLGTGVVLGLLLGPIGWFVTWRMQGRFRECPACSRPVRVQARRCRHCGAALASLDRRTARSELKGASRNDPW